MESKERGPAPVLGNFLLPCPHGPIRVCDQFIPDLPQKTLHSTFLNGLERDPVNCRCPAVFFRHPVGFVKRLHLANMGVQPPEAPSRPAFAFWPARRTGRTCSPDGGS